MRVSATPQPGYVSCVLSCSLNSLPLYLTLCRIFTPKRYRQLQVKDLPNIPTWRLGRDSNRRPSGLKASTLPMCHHTPLLPLILCSVHLQVHLFQSVKMAIGTFSSCLKCTLHLVS